MSSPPSPGPGTAKEVASGMPPLTSDIETASGLSWSGPEKQSPMNDPRKKLQGGEKLVELGDRTLREREHPLWVALTHSPLRRGTSGISAFPPFAAPPSSLRLSPHAEIQL